MTTPEQATRAKRFWVYDRGESTASHLARWSAINVRYWVVDQTTNLPVDEASTKRTAVRIAADMNRGI